MSSDTVVELIQPGILTGRLAEILLATRDDRFRPRRSKRKCPSFWLRPPI